MKTIQIDVFYPLPEGWAMCNTCELMMAQADLGQGSESRVLIELPPELIAEVQRLSAAIFSISERYPEQVQIKVWDPRSLQGMIKSIRHAVHRYPTFVMDGKIKLSGWEEEKLDEIIQSILEHGISAL